MKHLFTFVMVMLLSFSAFAENERFELNFNDNKVLHDDSDWEFLMHEYTYNFSVSKKIHILDGDSFIVHSYIEFDTPHTYSTFSELTHKIYTMGILSCSRKAFMLLRQVYVKEDSKIQAIQPIQPNEYVSEVEAPGTARNQMYLKVCSGETV
jgi:hypothetical protein